MYRCFKYCAFAILILIFELVRTRLLVQYFKYVRQRIFVFHLPHTHIRTIIKKCEMKRCDCLPLAQWRCTTSVSFYFLRKAMNDPDMKESYGPETWMTGNFREPNNNNFLCVCELVPWYVRRTCKRSRYVVHFLIFNGIYHWTWFMFDFSRICLYLTLTS